MSRGGVVFRAGGELCFLPALVVRQIAPLPQITRVPAAPPELAGVALAEGDVVPVIDLGGDRGKTCVLLVCSFMGEPMGVIGTEIVGIGHYDVDPAEPTAIIVGEARARPLDLGKIYTRIQARD